MTRKILFFSALTALFGSIGLSATAQTGSQGRQLFIDVHQLEPDKVTYEAVAQAHAKDLAIQARYGVEFIKYWVDEKKGLVYCLSSAADSTAIRKTHAAAHGLLPAQIYKVTDGPEAIPNGHANLYLDIHEIGTGAVTAKDVAAAHQKDLAVEAKYGVNFINYWVDEKKGIIVCLSEAKDSASVINTHREAHGLLPIKIMEVKQGN